VDPDDGTTLRASVALRRLRLQDALMRARPARRRAGERVWLLVAVVAVAALLGAGCVGWSFVRQQGAAVPPGRGTGAPPSTVR
jgi:hypothetical protein